MSGLWVLLWWPVRVTSCQHCWASPWASRLTSLLPSSLVVGSSRSQRQLPGPSLHLPCSGAPKNHARALLLSHLGRPIRLAWGGNSGLHLGKRRKKSQSLSGVGVITLCLPTPAPNIWAQTSCRRQSVAGSEVQDLLGIDLLASLWSLSLWVPPDPTSPPHLL